MPRNIAALIRHADYRQLAGAPSAHQPFPLNKHGRQQARKAGNAICQLAHENGWSVDTDIQSSQLLRAWETARLVADCLGPLYTISCHADLAERSVGSAANLTIQQIETVIREDPRFPELPENWKSNSLFRLPLQGAESLLEAGERVARHLDEVMRQRATHISGDSVKLFIGHGAAIRHAAYHLEIISFDDIARLSMHHARPVYFEFSDGRWSRIDGEWKVRKSFAELD